MPAAGAPLDPGVSVDIGGRILTPLLTADGLTVTLPANLGSNGNSPTRTRVRES